MAGKCDSLKSPSARHSPAPHAAVGAAREAGNSCSYKVTSAESRRAGRRFLSPCFQSFSRAAGAPSVGCPTLGSGRGCRAALSCGLCWAPATEQLSLCHSEGNEDVINEQLYLHPVSGCCSQPLTGMRGVRAPIGRSHTETTPGTSAQGKAQGRSLKEDSIPFQVSHPSLDRPGGRNRERKQQQCNNRHLGPDLSGWWLTYFLCIC